LRVVGSGGGWLRIWWVWNDEEESRGKIGVLYYVGLEVCVCVEGVGMIVYVCVLSKSKSKLNFFFQMVH